MIETVGERGYGATTIANVIAAAGVSRRTYYENFKNKEDCFRAAYEASFEFLAAEVGAAGAEEDWPESLRAGLERLLGSLASHPELAAFFLTAPASAGDEVAARHHAALRELVGALVARAPRQSSKAAATRVEALAGGLSRLLEMRVSAGRADELPGLLPDLVELFLRPYAGSKEAIRIARGA